MAYQEPSWADALERARQAVADLDKHFKILVDYSFPSGSPGSEPNTSKGDSFFTKVPGQWRAMVGVNGAFYVSGAAWRKRETERLGGNRSKGSNFLRYVLWDDGEHRQYQSPLAMLRRAGKSA